MSIEWEKYDSLDSFDLEIAAYLWEEAEKDPESVLVPMMITVRHNAMIYYLKAKTASVSRAALIKLAKEWKEKPKFLYPEERDKSDSEVSVNETPYTVSAIKSKENIGEAGGYYHLKISDLELASFTWDRRNNLLDAVKNYIKTKEKKARFIPLYVAACVAAEVNPTEEMVKNPTGKVINQILILDGFYREIWELMSSDDQPVDCSFRSESMRQDGKHQDFRDVMAGNKELPSDYLSRISTLALIPLTEVVIGQDDGLMQAHITEVVIGQDDGLMQAHITEVVIGQDDGLTQAHIRKPLPKRKPRSDGFESEQNVIAIVEEFGLDPTSRKTTTLVLHALQRKGLPPKDPKRIREVLRSMKPRKG